MAGGSIEKSAMATASSSEKNRVFSGAQYGFKFEADWNYELTTFYVSIYSADGKRILATTARVPTTNHPENFTDLNIPEGPRVAVNCEMK